MITSSFESNISNPGYLVFRLCAKDQVVAGTVCVKRGVEPVILKLPPLEATA
jgi:hypothetical protein